VCDIYYDVLIPLAGETLQVREGRHLRDDCEALGKPTASAGSHVGGNRPQRAQQVPGRVQRVCRRGRSLPRPGVACPKTPASAPGELPQRHSHHRHPPVWHNEFATRPTGSSTSSITASDGRAGPHSPTSNHHHHPDS
jgi:hypothetical protein